MSELVEVRESDRISQGFADVNDQPLATSSWEAYAMLALMAILCMAVTASWGALLVWGATWLIWR
jgi:hypothetical protein